MSDRVSPIIASMQSMIADMNTNHARELAQRDEQIADMAIEFGASIAQPGNCPGPCRGFGHFDGHLCDVCSGDGSV